MCIRDRRLCQYYCSCHCNVCAFPDSDPGGWRSSIPGSVIARLLLKPGRIFNALRYNAGSNLLWRGLHFSANLVVDWFTCVVSNHSDLECDRLCVVEATQIVVSTCSLLLSLVCYEEDTTSYGCWLFRNSFTEKAWNQGRFQNRAR